MTQNQYSSVCWIVDLSAEVVVKTQRKVCFYKAIWDLVTNEICAKMPTFLLGLRDSEPQMGISTTKMTGMLSSQLMNLVQFQIFSSSHSWIHCDKRCELIQDLFEMEYTHIWIKFIAQRSELNLTTIFDITLQHILLLETFQRCCSENIIQTVKLSHSNEWTLTKFKNRSIQPRVELIEFSDDNVYMSVTIHVVDNFNRKRTCFGQDCVYLVIAREW